jgi:2-dehydropantoate 2-reductase
MKVVIIGPGALGCLLAAKLSHKQQLPDTQSSPLDLWIFDHTPERARQLAENGLTFEEDGRQLHCPVNATADPAVISIADAIFLCVKSLDVTAGLEKAKSISGQDTLLITMQNGIGHLDILNAHNGPPSVALGVTAQGANMVGTGHVRHAGDGITRLGFLDDIVDSKKDLLAEISSRLCDAGIETVVVGNITEFVWAKLLVNVGINALTAIHGCANGKLLDSPSMKNQLSAAVREAEAVARAKGIAIAADPLTVTLEVCKQTGSNISSMLQDIRKKRLTEIDSINGAIVKAGRQLNIPVPVNEELVQQVKVMEKKYSSW